MLCEVCVYLASLTITSPEENFPDEEWPGISRLVYTKSSLPSP